MCELIYVEMIENEKWLKEVNTIIQPIDSTDRLTSLEIEIKIEIKSIQSSKPYN